MNAEALEETTDRIRRQATAFTTNYYANRQRTEHWIAQHALYLSVSHESCFLLRRDRSFWRVYHAAANADSLDSGFDSLHSNSHPLGGALVSDVIGHPDQVRMITEIYRRHGFRDYGRLCRMIRPGSGTDGAATENHSAHCAGIGDLADIAEFLEQQLDPFIDQIPGPTELRDAVTSQEVLIAREDQRLAGVLISEKTGFTAHLRYWYVGQEFRGRSIGANLIKFFFSRLGDKTRVLLWVREENYDAIAKYEHYGFRKDALVDQIMLGGAE